MAAADTTSPFADAPLDPIALEDETRALVVGLVQKMQGYRRHYLYIPLTPFNRSVSAVLQEVVGRCDGLQVEKRR